MSDAGGGSQLRSLSGVAPLGQYVRDLWQRREFTWSLATGSLRSEHLDTVLGNAWHVLNPTLLILVYYVIFGVLLEANRGVDNFIAFLALGIFTFSFIQRTVTSCGSSISNNIGLIRSLQFPRAVLPVSTVIREVSGYGFTLVVVIGVLLITEEWPTWSWLLAPFVVILLTMFNTGVGLIVARLTDSVRDFANIIPFIFRILFYASGIIFSIDVFVPRRIQPFFILDPYFTYIDLLRGVLMRSYDPLFLLEEWVFAIVAAPVTFLIGLLYFRAGEKGYGRG